MHIEEYVGLGRAVAVAQAPVEVLRVAAETPAPKLAGAVAGVLRGAPQVELQAVGAGAVNQAVKAIAIARSYLRDEGIDLAVQPSFVVVTIPDHGEVSAIHLVVVRQRREG
jgi:stage V sporulation protein S